MENCLESCAGILEALLQSVQHDRHRRSLGGVNAKLTPINICKFNGEVYIHAPARIALGRGRYVLHTGKAFHVAQRNTLCDDRGAIA